MECAVKSTVSGLHPVIGLYKNVPEGPLMVICLNTVSKQLLPGPEINKRAINTPGLL